MRGAAISVIVAYDDADPARIANLFRATLVLNGVRGDVSEPVLVDDLAVGGYVETVIEGEM